MEPATKTSEQKYNALQSLWNSVTQTEPQEQIAQIQFLARSEEMNAFIKTNGILTSKYTFSDFLDEIFRCLYNLQLRQQNFTTKMQDLFFQQFKVLSLSRDDFTPWVKFCFKKRKIDFVRIVGLCGILFEKGDQIPFSFISTQIIRLFYSPNSSCVNFLKAISSQSSEEVLEKFSEYPDPELQKYIIKLASFVLSDQNAITPFNKINNSLGFNNDSKENTQEHLQCIIKNLSFYLLPEGYQAYAHTDYQKNIYLLCEHMPANLCEYDKIIMSVISLIHEVGHVKRIESAPFDCPLHFTPLKLNCEAGASVEEQIFGAVIDLMDVKLIDSGAILRDENISYNFLYNLKAAFSKVKSFKEAGIYQNKVLSLPKD